MSKTRISRCAVDHAASEAVHDFRILLQEVLSRRVRQRPIINNWRALLDHLHADMAHASVERFRVLHLDTRNALIRDEIMSEGTIDHTAVHVRKVVTRALELGSASLILVHNHPSGTTSPSRADVAITRRLVQACQAVELVVHDHLIIGAEGHTSMRAEGLM